MKVNNFKKKEKKAPDPNVSGRRRDFGYFIKDEIKTADANQKLHITVEPFDKEKNSTYVFGVYLVKEVNREDMS